MSDNTLLLVAAAGTGVYLATEGFGSIISSAFQGAEGLAGDVGQGLAKGASTLENAVSGVPGAINSTLDTIVDGADDAVSGAGIAAGEVAEGINRAGTELGTDLSAVGQGAADDLGDVGAGVVKGAEDATAEVLEQFITTTVSDIEGVVESLGLALTDLFESDDGELFEFRQNNSPSRQKYTVEYADPAYITTSDRARIQFGETMVRIARQSPLPLDQMGKPFDRYIIPKGFQNEAIPIYAWRISWIRAIQNRMALIETGDLSEIGVQRYFDALSELKEIELWLEDQALGRGSLADEQKETQERGKSSSPPLTRVSTGSRRVVQDNFDRQVIDTGVGIVDKNGNIVELFEVLNKKTGITSKEITGFTTTGSPISFGLDPRFSGLGADASPPTSPRSRGVLRQFR